MSLFNDIEISWKAAMKARDPKKDVFSSIRTEVKNRVIATRTTGAGDIDASDETVLETLRKMAKMRRESIEEYLKAERDDLATKEFFELQVIESFLPKQLTPDEVAVIAKAVVAELGAAGPKDMGRVMKATIAKVDNRADGKIVSQAVKAVLG